MSECNYPKLIFLTGVDGAGKTTLSKWLVGYLEDRGVETKCVWSRFHNYLSKPLLALTRLTGHNYYKTIDGVRFGYHNFENLHVYRHIFLVLQAVDVNIATRLKIHSQAKNTKVLVCERGPWDTLVDVMSDTGIYGLSNSFLGGLYTAAVRKNAEVFLVKRDLHSILETRPELINDYKLETRIALYEKLAIQEGWCVIDNNQTLDKAKEGMALQLEKLAGQEARV